MNITPLTLSQKTRNIDSLIEVLETAGEDCIKTVKFRGLWVDNYFVCEIYRDLIGRDFFLDFKDEFRLIGNGNRFSFSLNPNFDEATQIYSICKYSEYETRQIKIMCLEILKAVILNP